MTKATMLTFGVILFFVTVEKGSSINCYQCNSLVDEDCDVLSEVTNQTYLKPCDTSSMPDRPLFCRKTIFTILDTVKESRVIRGCGWEAHSSNKSYCMTNDSDFKLGKVCQCFTDGCNSSGFLSASRIALSLSLLATLISRS